VNIVGDSLANAFAGDNRSALAAVGDIELSVRMLDSRVAQIQQTFLKQARWQAELLLADAARQPVVDSVMGQMSRLNLSMERVTAVAESMPDLIDQERIETFLSVTQERIATLQAITAEREALLAALASERATVVEALHEERVGTLKDAEASAQRLIDYTLARRLELLVNYVLLRLFLGAVALILLAMVAGLIVVSVARRRGRFASA
jgi:flagellar biosynthesis/type III secretory pathway chaperone